MIPPGLTEPEVLAGLRAFPDAQRLLAGESLDLVPGSDNLVANPSGESGVPSSVSPSGTSTTLLNLILNPSFEVSTADWVAAASGGTTLTTFARQSGWAKDGTWAARYTASVGTAGSVNFVNATAPTTKPACTVGEWITARCSAYILTNTSQIVFTINWFTAAGAFLSTSTDVAAAGVTGLREFVVTAQAPATAGLFNVTMQVSNVIGTVDMYFDSVLLARSATPLAYFDGDTYGYGWTGTAHASTSQPVGSTVDSTAWARTGTHSSRLRITRDDVATLAVGRTPSGVNGIPVTPGNWYAARVSVHPAALGNPVATQRAVIYWYTAAGAAASTVSTAGPNVPTEVEAVGDQYVIAQAPANAAFAAVSSNMSTTVAVVGSLYIIDTDAYMLVDLGTTTPLSSGGTTNPADVPVYVEPEAAFLPSASYTPVGVITVGWHDTTVQPYAGCFAVVAESRPEMADLVGEILRVGGEREREVLVYVLGRADVDQPISLSRRAFLALSGLWREELSALVWKVTQ